MFLIILYFFGTVCILFVLVLYPKTLNTQNSGDMAAEEKYKVQECEKWRANLKKKNNTFHHFFFKKMLFSLIKSSQNKKLFCRTITNNQLSFPPFCSNFTQIRISLRIVQWTNFYKKNYTLIRFIAKSTDFQIL